MVDSRKPAKEIPDNEEEDFPTLELVIKQGSTVQAILQDVANLLHVKMILKLSENNEIIEMDTVEPGGSYSNAATTADSAALYFLHLARTKGLAFSDSKLHNLLFYAQGWYLAASGECLFDEPLSVSKQGVLYLDLWDTVTPNQVDDVDYRSIPDDARKCLHMVFESYSHFNDLALQNLVRSTDPWSDAMVSGEHTHVSPETLLDYFQDISSRIAMVPDNRSIN